MTTAEDIQIHSLDEAFSRDRFLMVQKRLAINEKYFISNDQNERVLFVERKQHLLQQLLAVSATFVVILAVAMGIGSVLMLDELSEPLKGGIAMAGILLGGIGAVATFLFLYPKRHVTFYRDDTRRETLLSITQDNQVQILFAHFTVLDASGVPLAKLRKNQLTNLFRKCWECKHPNGSPMCVAMEDSIAFAILRRLFGTMMGALRTNFILLAGTGVPERLLGKFDRQFTLFDKYVLDMTTDPMRELDRRVALAIGVLLDTGERR